MFRICFRICAITSVLVSMTFAAMAQTSSMPTNHNVQAALFDELVELYPDSDISGGQSAYEVHAARNTIAGVHVLVTHLKVGEPLAFRAEADGRPVAGARWYQLIDVPVEENTGLSSRTERFDGKKNPYVIRRAPFRVFEVLKPVSSAIKPGRSVVDLRFEIPIAADASPGPRRYTLTIEQGGVLLPLEFRVTVHRAIVPAIGADTLSYTNWFNPHFIATRHGLKPWSEEFWSMLAKYARLMARGRQNTFWVRWGDMFTNSAETGPLLNRERLERYVRTFTEAGLYTIEGAPFAHRPGGNWSSNTLDLGVVNLPADSPEGRAVLRAMAGQLLTAIKENGWEGRWVQHLSDEPTDTNTEAYKSLSAALREFMPGVPIVEATMSIRLAGAVDIWCPKVQEYQHHRDFFETRRKQGERVWVYTCLSPGGPWLNRLLDMERLRQVYMGWAIARYDLDGFLHWGLNHYRGDPFEQSVVVHGGPNNRLPAGDSHVIYPGSDGPWSGQRFEAHRIGFEDYELLKILRRREPDGAAAIIKRVVRAFDDYDTDVSHYRQAKRELLDRLDH